MAIDSEGEKEEEEIVNKEVSLENDIFGKIEVLRMLDHPNIVKIHDSYVEKQRVCIVMDYAEGGRFKANFC